MKEDHRAEIDKYRIQIFNLNDEIRKKDLLFKEQGNILKENQLINAKLQEHFISHLRENIRENTQNFHLELGKPVYQEIITNKKKTKIKDVSIDELTTKELFLQGLEKIVKKEIESFKKTILEHKINAVPSSPIKTIAIPSINYAKMHISLDYSPTAKDYRGQVDDVLANKEAAMDKKKAGVEKELKKMLAGIQIQRRNLTEAQSKY